MTISAAELPQTHQAVRELASRDGPDALTTLRETATAAQDQFVRRMAIEVIGKHGQGHELRDVVLHALDDKSDYVVRAACDVVAQWKLGEAHDAVVALLKSASMSTRQTAISTLGSIWQDTDLAVLFDIYKHDRDVRLRRDAAWMLRHRSGRAAWRMLFDVFHVDGLPRHRTWACELAATHCGREVLPVLERLRSDRDGHVRAAAERAIAAIGGT